MRRIEIWLTAGLALVGLTQAAGAGEGAIEINQTSALAGETGDPAGFPVVISEPGLHRLTSNLDLRGIADPANTNAIEITVDDVTLDLGGFRIIGATDCSGLPSTPCTGTGTGTGISAIGLKGIVVRNGTIRGMGLDGVSLYGTRGARVQDVRVLSNGGTGIAGTGSATVTRCLALQNGADGIRSGRGTIAENLVARNGQAGIQGEAIVRRNVVSENGGLGLVDGAAYAENFFFFNNAGGAQISSSAPQPAANACSFNAACP